MRSLLPSSAPLPVRCFFCLAQLPVCYLPSSAELPVRLVPGSAPCQCVWCSLAGSAPLPVRYFFLPGSAQLLVCYLPSSAQLLVCYLPGSAQLPVCLGGTCPVQPRCQCVCVQLARFSPAAGVLLAQFSPAAGVLLALVQPSCCQAAGVLLARFSVSQTSGVSCPVSAQLPVQSETHSNAVRNTGDLICCYHILPKDFRFRHVLLDHDGQMVGTNWV